MWRSRHEPRTCASRARSSVVSVGLQDVVNDEYEHLRMTRARPDSWQGTCLGVRARVGDKSR